MKFIFLFLFLFCSQTNASQGCREQSERIVKIKEDYKSFVDVSLFVEAEFSALYKINDPLIINPKKNELRSKMNDAYTAFKIYGNLKGSELFSASYDYCKSKEKIDSERAKIREKRNAVKENPK